MAAPENVTATTPAPTGAPPGAPERNQNIPRSYYREPGGTMRRDLSPREMLEVRRAPQGVLWVDVDATNRHQHAILEKLFGFHPLAIEDTLNPESRAKVEQYDGYMFLIIRGIAFEDKTDDPYDLRTFNLCFFLGPDYLVTVHGEPSRSIAEVEDQVCRSPDLLDRGAARLMHSIMDASVDRYFPIVEQIDEFIETLEDRVFHKFDPNTLQDVFAVKRLVVSLRRHLSPQREVFNILTNRPNPLLTPEIQLYYRDIYDHMMRLNESFETQRELLSGTADAYLTQVSNRLGNVSKGLAIAATLSVPFVVVSGMWGMNFEKIPLSHNPAGFWLMLALQLLLGVVFVVLLKWRKLL
jgi:magnesium transporter